MTIANLKADFVRTGFTFDGPGANIEASMRKRNVEVPGFVQVVFADHLLLVLWDLDLQPPGNAV